MQSEGSGNLWYVACEHNGEICKLQGTNAPQFYHSIPGDGPVYQSCVQTPEKIKTTSQKS